MASGEDPVGAGAAVCLLFVVYFAAAEAFLECRYGFVRSLHFLGCVVLLRFGYCLLDRGWVAEELCAEFFVWAFAGHNSQQ